MEEGNNMKQKQGSVTNNDVVSVLPVKQMQKQLPTHIARYVMGANVVHPWHGRKDVFSLEDVYGKTLLAPPDYSIVKAVGDQVILDLKLDKIIPAHQILVIRDRAAQILEAMTDTRAGKKGIVMLKDQGGCGYWRMVLPSRYMDRTGVYIDDTGAGLDFNSLLEYETILVQRVHNWDSFEILRRLKEAGRRVIYDLDDDIFSIPVENPAFRAIGRNEQMAALECMKVADVVTVSTSALQAKLGSMLEKYPVVIRNAIDPDDGWLPTPVTGSPDGWKRIFWQGSNTHNEDWNECFEAVDHIMMSRDDIRMVILGFLPTCIQNCAEMAHWKGRIEYLGPMDPEAYFRMVKHVRADVGLAPLRDTVFNASKSNIKWMENTMIGMPTVASDVEAYSGSIQHGETGFLCSTPEGWYEAIEKCLEDGEIKKRMVENARQQVRNECNIKTVARTWRDILLG